MTKIPKTDFDKYISRVLNRLKFVEELEETIPRTELRETFYRLLWHGQEICTEHEPKCDACPLKKFCPSRI